MQGRLVPPEGGRLQAFPRARWADEPRLAREAGLSSIEWIYDTYGEGANPIESDEGIAEMRELADEAGIAIRSLCADWFMDHLLVHAAPAERTERLERLRWLIARCERAGIGRIVLPFVDSASLSSAEDHDLLVACISDVVDDAGRAGVELHLETDLPPAKFRELLDRLPEGAVFVNYDSGNSASLGYDAREELAAYGSRVGSVHVKDRVRGGGTVPLGQGDAQLHAVAEGLLSLGYSGDVILQVARGEDGDELEAGRRNRDHVEAIVKAAA